MSIFLIVGVTINVERLIKIQKKHAKFDLFKNVPEDETDEHYYNEYHCMLNNGNRLIPIKCLTNSCPNLGEMADYCDEHYKPKKHGKNLCPTDKIVKHLNFPIIMMLMNMMIINNVKVKI